MLGEVIRFYMTPWIQAEHPDWQDINSPGGKPITVEQLKDSAVLGCWNSPYGDWFIKSQVELVKRLDWDGYNMDGFGCWSQCFCPSCRASYQKRHGQGDPGHGRRQRFRRSAATSSGGSIATRISSSGGRPRSRLSNPTSWRHRGRPGPAAGGTGWAHRRRRGPTQCTACSTPRSSSCSGTFPPTRGATCCLRSRAGTTAA